MESRQSAPPPSDDEGERLKPYVPRLLIDWIRESPATSYQAREGSLAFVDISGFTALTESLARRGKIGAELLRDTLDGVFVSLLDEAYAWGAGLLKWGGDALLLLFDGPGHPERAARAAWEMQRTMDRVGRIRVPGGTTTLRMSIGITSGTVEFFTAGSVHRELLIVGPAATEAVAMEAIADAGEVALSSALARLLDPSCVGAPKAEAFLLRASPSAAHGHAADAVSAEGVDVASCIPLAARDHVLAQRSEPEHRIVTATFVELMHTDELLASVGPTTLAEALDERLSTIQETAARYEVPFNATDVSKGSVKVLLTAGAPSSTGHDEEQTLRMARELSERPGLIPVRIGIDTGRVFSGDFGPSYRRTYTALGDAINTAARVMSRAEAGQVLATEAVLRRSRTTFSTTPIQPFSAKGKAELVQASIVGPIVGRRDEREAETPLLGRDDELTALRSVLDDVRAGDGWIVEISGRAGVGRSRLVHELIESCADMRVLQARCEEYEASTPYYVLRAPMRAVLGLGADADAAAVEGRLREVVARIDDELVPFVPLLGILLGLDLSPTPETSSLDARFLRDRLAEVAMRFFVGTLGDAATMLSVEDGHYMDEASADLLLRLTRAASSLRFVLVVTHADPSTTWAPAGEEGLRCFSLSLLPLSERSAVRIVEAATDDRPLPPHVVEAIARRSGGNVLFLFELIDMARATGSADALPDSVEAVIAAEIDRLSPSDRTVLRYASVLGASFDPGRLAAAVEETELDDALWQRLHGLVDRDAAGGMRFRNTLVREAAYEGLPFRRRRQLHARVADAIEASATSLEAEAPALALHYFEAQRHERAWHYGRMAGDHAQAVAAPVEAARFYELALAAGARMRNVGTHDRAAVWISLGDARETAGMFDASFKALRRATRLLADDPLEQARVHALRARVRARTTSYRLALRETTAGLRLLDIREDASGVRASLRAMRAEIRWFQGRPHEAVALAKLAIDDVGGSEEVEPLMALARAYTALDGSYRMLGQPELARHEPLALEIYERLGQLRLVGIQALNLGTSAYWYGRWDEAADLYRRASADLLRAGDRQNAAAAACNLGELLIGRGQLDEAERVLVEARRTLRAVGATPWVLFVETQLARCALERSDVEGATQSFGRIIEEARGVGYAASVLEMTVYYAQVEAMAGRAEAGLAALDQAATAAGGEAALYAAPLERARSVCLRVLGRADESRACLDRALAAAEAQGQLYEQLLARSSRAGVMAGMEKDEELREVLRLAQLLGITG